MTKETNKGPTSKGPLGPLSYGNSKLNENIGQAEGRDATMSGAIEWLQSAIVQFYPDVVITESNYEMYMSRYHKKTQG